MVAQYFACSWPTTWVDSQFLSFTVDTDDRWLSAPKG